MIIRFIGIFFVLLGVGCSSAPVKTQRYSFQAPKMLNAPTPLNLKGGLGIGPVSLPESWRQREIPVWGPGAELILNSQQQWVGDPKLAISRVLATQISQACDSADIWAHPWDARTRPATQILLNIEVLGGPLEGPLQLTAKWQIANQFGVKRLQLHRQTFELPVKQANYAGYVETINQLIHQLGSAMTQSLLSLKPDNE